ncbi:hypothetical protein [Spiroplasma endosymbiont of Amphimallon solstitiale]|uniref:hypothetical protein n=1 Tax=Spiroplasma endosymbiont of Amphimallon solstitiale TaxID=3066288 RepID=UPI00313EAB83
MKYFSPSYWFKLWVLSAPLFNDKTQGINAKSIDNKNIKDWASNNTNLQSINQDMSFINSSTNYQPYNLNDPQAQQNIDPFYQTYLDSLANPELETSTHKHRHEKSRNRVKRDSYWDPYYLSFQNKIENNRWNEDSINYGSVSGDPLWHTYLHISREKWLDLRNNNRENAKDFFLYLSHYDYVADTLVELIWNNFDWIDKVYKTLNYNNGLRIHIKGYTKDGNAELINVSPLCTECNNNPKPLKNYINTIDQKDLDVIQYGSVSGDPLWHTYLGISREKWLDLRNNNRENAKDFFLYLSHYDYVADTLVELIWNNFDWIDKVYKTLNYNNGLRIHIKGYTKDGNAELINVSPLCTECNDREQIKRLGYVIKNENLGEIQNNDFETILNKIKSKNSDLDIKDITINKITDKTATINVKKNSYKYYRLSWININFSIQDTIKFLGYNNEYKGGIGLDTTNKKIIFSKNNNIFHLYFDGIKLNSKATLYNSITLINDFDKKILEININGTNSMQDIIKKYDLSNGINYENVYLIQIFSTEPWRTKFYEGNQWKCLTENRMYNNTQKRNLTEDFIILDDKISSFDYMKNEFHLINDWHDKVNAWKIRVDDDIKQNLPTFTLQQKNAWKNQQLTNLDIWKHQLKQNLEIIKNSQNIKKLTTNFESIKKQINDLDKRVTDLENVSNWNCANIVGINAAVIAPIPVIGTISSAVLGIIAGSCAIAGV